MKIAQLCSDSFFCMEHVAKILVVLHHHADLGLAVFLCLCVCTNMYKNLCVLHHITFNYDC